MIATAGEWLACCTKHYHHSSPVLIVLRLRAARSSLVKCLCMNGEPFEALVYPIPGSEAVGLEKLAKGLQAAHQRTQIDGLYVQGSSALSADASASLSRT